MEIKNNLKDSAVDFLNLVTSGKISEAYQKYVSADMKHHNPYFAGDAKSLQAGMEENESKFPNKIYEVKQVLQDGDIVAVHGKVSLGQGQPEMVVVHICKFKNGKIIELWDVGQTIPSEMLNENGM